MFRLEKRKEKKKLPTEKIWGIIIEKGSGLIK